eukprot:6204108-Pleurochrysis_carterae.AAC.1
MHAYARDEVSSDCHILVWPRLGVTIVAARGAKWAALNVEPTTKEGRRAHSLRTKRIEDGLAKITFSGTKCITAKDQVYFLAQSCGRSLLAFVGISASSSID